MECQHDLRLTCGNPPRVICRECGSTIAWVLPPVGPQRDAVIDEELARQKRLEFRTLLDRSSIGAGLRNIRENGIDAELDELAARRKRK